MKLSCYIVDDEYHAIDLLKVFIEKAPDVELIGSNSNPVLSIAEIDKNQPDVLFLDVDMPEMSGLDLAQIQQSNAIIVYTTSYREYGPEAYERNAADYLLKPFTYDRFLAALDKIRQRKATLNMYSDDLIYVKTGDAGSLRALSLQEIQYISGLSNYVVIHLLNDHMITYLTLKELQEKLPANFCRIHKSSIVNLNSIKIIEKDQVGLQDGTSLTIGPSYQATFLKQITPRMLTPSRLH